VLPSTVEVFVAERTPMGITRIGSELYLIDRGGFVIAEFGPQYAEFDFPVIDGVVQAPRGSEPTLDAARAGLAARFLDETAADPDLARRVSQVNVNDPRNVVVLLDGDTTLLHLGTEKFAERLQSYVELAPTLRASVPEIDYVELRFAPRIYVQPVRGTRAVASRPFTAGN
jgi:cell division septal protein FtsQ